MSDETDRSTIATISKSCMNSLNYRERDPLIFRGEIRVGPLLQIDRRGRRGPL